MYISIRISEKLEDFKVMFIKAKHKLKLTSKFDLELEANLRVGMVVLRSDLLRRLLGLSGRATPVVFFLPFNIDSIFSFFRVSSSLCCLQEVLS